MDALQRLQFKTNAVSGSENASEILSPLGVAQSVPVRCGGDCSSHSAVFHPLSFSCPSLFRPPAPTAPVNFAPSRAGLETRQSYLLEFLAVSDYSFWRISSVGSLWLMLMALAFEHMPMLRIRHVHWLCAPIAFFHLRWFHRKHEEMTPWHGPWANWCCEAADLPSYFGYYSFSRRVNRDLLLALGR